MTSDVHGRIDKINITFKQTKVFSTPVAKWLAGAGVGVIVYSHFHSASSLRPPPCFILPVVIPFGYFFATFQLALLVATITSAHLITATAPLVVSVLPAFIIVSSSPRCQRLLSIPSFCHCLPISPCRHRSSGSASCCRYIQNERIY
ncbi:hypothetical protein YC2023_051266 [Brassica napus]